MVKLFIKDLFYHFKNNLSALLSCTMALMLLLTITIISDKLIDVVQTNSQSIVNDVSLIEVYDERNYYELTKKVEGYKYLACDYGEFKLVGCDNIAALFNLTCLKGRFFNELDLMNNMNVAVLGYDLLAYFNYPQVNDFIYIDGACFKIIGILAAGQQSLYDNFDNYLLVPSSYLFAYKEYRLFTINKLTPKELESKLLSQDYLLINNEFTKDNLTHILKTTKVCLLFLGYFSVVMALMGVVNNSLTTLKSRYKEIAIKKVLGASNKIIVIQFMLESFLVIVVSIIMASGIIMIVVKLFKIQVVSYANCGHQLAIVSMMTLFSGLYPAYKAQKVEISALLTQG